MKSTLAPGTALKRTVTIDRPRTIDFMGEELRVYATPEMIRDIEYTCRELLAQHCDPGEDSVGTRVEVDHMGPALLGSQVEISVAVKEVKGRAVIFEVTVQDPAEQIGRGLHSRFVVDVAKTRERLAAKAAKSKTS
jgi:fluoroacetyl-CoA thioesterase